MTIALDYPHDTRTHEPLQLTKRDIWRLAEDARSQVGGSKKPKLNFTDLAAKARKLRINGLELETRWEFAPGVHDERGHSVLGAIEYDPAVQRTALVYLNSAELADREDITRSTAAHELAHAISMPRVGLANATALRQRRSSLPYALSPLFAATDLQAQSAYPNGAQMNSWAPSWLRRTCCGGRC